MITTAFYCPHYIEYLFDFFGEYGIKTNQEYSESEKRKVLESLSDMLNNHVLSAGINKDMIFHKWDLDNYQIIARIKLLWDKNLKFPEFYEIVSFRYDQWYVKALEEEGFLSATNWEKFVEEKIGNLEKWIEENRPKDE